jgi:hypothetical protein
MFGLASPLLVELSRPRHDATTERGTRMCLGGTTDVEVDR